jgi:hypothetical protein
MLSPDSEWLHVATPAYRRLNMSYSGNTLRATLGSLSFCGHERTWIGSDTKNQYA